MMMMMTVKTFRDVIDVVRGFFNGTAADTEWKLFVVGLIFIFISLLPS